MSAGTFVGLGVTLRSMWFVSPRREVEQYLSWFEV